MSAGEIVRYVRQRTYSARHYRVLLKPTPSRTAHVDVPSPASVICRGTGGRGGSTISITQRRFMKIPVETKPALWGLAGGAVAAAIVGFTWGGWVTGGRAEAEATQRASAAVVAALAPVCVQRFQTGPDAAGNLAALKKVDGWSQGDFVEKGGWATIPGSKPTDEVAAVAKACAVLLAAT
jgi:hypothetical protein